MQVQAAEREQSLMGTAFRQLLAHPILLHFIVRFINYRRVAAPLEQPCQCHSSSSTATPCLLVVVLAIPQTVTVCVTVTCGGTTTLGRSCEPQGTW